MESLGVFATLVFFNSSTMNQKGIYLGKVMGVLGVLGYYTLIVVCVGWVLVYMTIEIVVVVLDHWVLVYMTIEMVMVVRCCLDALFI